MSTIEIVKGRQLQIGQKVRVYVNLHKQGRFSIVDMKTGLVCAYATNCLLTDVTFYCSDTGREAVRREKCKRVHAWVRGNLAAIETEHPAGHKEKVIYNPYVHDGFTDRTGELVETADSAFLSEKQIFLTSLERG